MTFLETYQGFIFDLDGTLYRGDELIPGAEKVINHLKQTGKSILLVTNKTTSTTADYIQFLRAHGAVVSDEDIISAASLVTGYAAEHFHGKKFFAVGEEAFIQGLIDAGLEYSEKPGAIDLVIVTLDRYLTLKKLEIAAHAIENGARFLAANIDDTCPVEGDEIWDAGSTIAALEKRTHRKLEMHFGKPSAFMIDAIFSRLHFPGKELLLVGDRMETDIHMAKVAGITSVLVKTGVKNDLSNLNGSGPDFILNSVADLLHTIPQ